MGRVLFGIPLVVFCLCVAGCSGRSLGGWWDLLAKQVRHRQASSGCVSRSISSRHTDLSISGVLPWALPSFLRSGLCFPTG